MVGWPERHARSAPEPQISEKGDRSSITLAKIEKQGETIKERLPIDKRRSAALGREGTAA